MKDIENKKILYIETFPDSPLIETSCEIALNLRKKNQVFFFGLVMICISITLNSFYNQNHKG